MGHCSFYRGKNCYLRVLVGQRGVGSSSPTLSVWSPAPTSPTLLCCPCHRAKLAIALGVSLAHRLPPPPLLLVGSLSLLCECVVLWCCWSSSSSSAAAGEGVARRVACACGSSLSLLSSSPSSRSPSSSPLSAGFVPCSLASRSPQVASCLVRLLRFAAIDSSVASKQQQPTKGLLFLLGARALSLPRLVPSSLCSRGR